MESQRRGKDRIIYWTTTGIVSAVMVALAFWPHGRDKLKGPAKAPFASTPQIPGWEFEFVLMGGALALVFTGAGRLSIDDLIGL